MISLDNQVVSDKMAILGTIIGKGAVRMEAHERVLHELLKMGEMLLGCGAEINRVEDTMTRLGRAYGAKRVDIFVITSDIVLTVLFDDGAELTQTRRISGSPATDFAKLEALNALSRKVCAAPVSAAVAIALHHQSVFSSRYACRSVISAFSPIST